MENFQILKLDVSIKDEVLSMCTDADALNHYLSDHVSPIIFEAIAAIPKGGELGGRVACDTRGECRVEVGGTWRF
ncbi:hypothetical protein [Dyadobacter chenhuakuii]|uniref:Uncharacterized protein n=1 Tax=Dyadobacter chenhuakuii TaxID=2909339 RepID=A0ABY4XME0_9BACT|nr:hypothetical protein [Dyadobacter chenhuakuii]MCF2494302.1 hypothetical protein [Dyadobacter chenhuakuii]USJ31426.1 hypothetical protein NFI80_01530 [Dyadobacter chenhuakuii]